MVALRDSKGDWPQSSLSESRREESKAVAMREEESFLQKSVLPPSLPQRGRIEEGDSFS